MCKENSMKIMSLLLVGMVLASVGCEERVVVRRPQPVVVVSRPAVVIQARPVVVVRPVRPVVRETVIVR